MGGAKADVFNLEPELRKKISGAGAEEKWLGSATLHLTRFGVSYLSTIKTRKKSIETTVQCTLAFLFLTKSKFLFYSKSKDCSV